jgi:hypothetical protein
MYFEVLDAAMRTMNACDVGDLTTFAACCAVELPKGVDELGITATMSHDDLLLYLPMLFMQAMADTARRTKRGGRPPISPSARARFTRPRAPWVPATRRSA